MICPKCNEETLDTSKFCPNCGHRFADDNPCDFITDKVSLENHNFKATKRKNIRFRGELIFPLVFILVTGVYCVHFIKNIEAKNTINKTVETKPLSKVSSTNDKIKVSLEEAQKYVESFCGWNMPLKREGIVKSNEIKGADDLVGKYCYFYGNRDSKSINYVVDAGNGYVYGCIGYEGTALKLIIIGHGTDKVTAVPTNNSQNTTSKEISTNTRDLKNAVKGHWVGIKNGEHFWYGDNVQYERARVSGTSKYECIIISDRKQIDSILSVYRDKKIYIPHSPTDIEKIEFNFTDDMLNNSIIVNTQGEDGTPYNDLLVFSEDKKSFKEYGLHKYQDYFIGYSDEYYFVDSKEKP